MGGIQTVCRTMAFALGSIYGEELKILALDDDTNDLQYIRSQYFKGYKKNKMSFAFEAIRHGCQHQTTIISHINLLPLAVLIRIFNKNSRIIMLAHGTEICRPKVLWKRWFIRKHISCWAVSHFTAENLSRFHGINKNIQIVTNCLDPFFQIPGTFFKPAYLLNRYRLSPGQSILMTICRIGQYETDKGYDKIINLLKQIKAQFPDIHYLLCGQAEKSEQQRLRTLIDQNLLNTYVTLTGPIPSYEITDHYLLADTFILPSNKEGFGIVFIEAAACGCQLIGGGSDGSREALLNGKSGLLVDPSKPDELYDAITRQLKTKWNKEDKKVQQEMAIKHFGYSQYESKIRHLLNRNKNV